MRKDASNPQKRERTIYRVVVQTAGGSSETEVKKRHWEKQSVFTAIR